jgi:hypothetical protein
MKNRFEFLKLVEQKFNFSDFYSIRIEEHCVYFQGRLSSNLRTEIEQYTSQKFQLSNNDWVEIKGEGYQFTLTF